MIRKLSVFCLLAVLCLTAAAQRVDTIKVHSASMNVDVRTVVILPKDYNGRKALPVLYLLHGYGGHHKTWITVRPDLPETATRMQMIVVCPDGRNSWYIDSPVRKDYQYETFMTAELPRAIDSLYATVAAPEGRAVTGLSMGGHGALRLGFLHPEVYGACGATSGGVDLRPFPENWNLTGILGARRDFPERWAEASAISHVDRIKPGTAIIIDCGTSDFFYSVNEQLHKELLYRNIGHEYTTRPGAHNGEYWANSIMHQLYFFDSFFARSGH